MPDSVLSDVGVESKNAHEIKQVHVDHTCVDYLDDECNSENNDHLLTMLSHECSLGAHASNDHDDMFENFLCMYQDYWSVLEPYICDYVDPVPEWDLPKFRPLVFSDHYIGPVKSQLHPQVWLAELSFEHDQYLKSYLLDGVKNGFKIVDADAVIASYDSENYNSVSQIDAWVVVNKLISKELSLGKYLSVQSKPWCIHALGAVKKKRTVLLGP